MAVRARKTKHFGYVIAYGTPFGRYFIQRDGRHVNRLTDESIWPNKRIAARRAKLALALSVTSPATLRVVIRQGNELQIGEEVWPRTDLIAKLGRLA